MPEEKQEVQQRRMCALLAGLAPLEGYNLSPLADVRFLRSNRPLGRTPVLYDPGIVIVCQGRKRGYLGDDVYLYDAQHYLAVSVPVPFSMETDASAQAPMLAIYLRLDFKLAADLMLQMDRGGSANAAEPKGMMSSLMDKRMTASVLRFLEAMSEPLEAAVLGPALVREIYFRVLSGEQGGSIRSALSRPGQFGKISQAIRAIHTGYASPISIEQLAGDVGMSVPSFHTHFKAVTDTSPMQYLKSTRLHQARLLMLRNGATVALACHQVGYVSVSQFSREFKRLFGLSPREEVERMRQHFALPPPDPASEYVSSH
ncbi:AraC family transcriptional regulator [Undibacterium terreum]|uniref:Transcriptional regulator n=1 Tax=Undibacterium terreum TaxID=1224302 RepID=A0A916UAQ0_9BURK|nr:AraC family transcriptional regulator [Undibacterium terreum]GGC65405.1 transcriptional regulator [Undibacterium terreum]